jgi:hypothetical protein
MEFFVFLPVFLLFYYLVNKGQSVYGLFPKLVQEYETDLAPDYNSILKSKDINLIEPDNFDKRKSPEYRPWLCILECKDGLFIGQFKMLILPFPKKMLIPWSKIRLLKKSKSFFNTKYVYEVDLGSESIYMLTKFKVVEVVN